MVRAQTPRGMRKSPGTFFALTAVLFAPFPIIAAFVHVPGLPKNAPVTDFIAAFLPAIAALILTYRTEGKRGVRHLLLRTVDLQRIRRRLWYLPVLLLPLACLGATYVLMTLTGMAFPLQPNLSPTTALLFAVVFFAAAAGEELGWSGYAFGPLQQRWGALGGSLLLGALWWIFHIPSILQSGQGSALIALGAFSTVATRVLWCWLFNNAGGSVCAIIVVHAVSNMCGAYVPSIPTSANAPVVVLLAVIVTVLWGPRTLAHFRFKPATDPAERR